MTLGSGGALAAAAVGAAAPAAVGAAVPAAVPRRPAAAPAPASPSSPDLAAACVGRPERREEPYSTQTKAVSRATRRCRILVILVFVLTFKTSPETDLFVYDAFSGPYLLVQSIFDATPFSTINLFSSILCYNKLHSTNRFSKHNSVFSGK